MIRRFEHRGLKILYDKDDRRGVSAEHVEKTARVLARLAVVTRPEQLNARLCAPPARRRSRGILERRPSWSLENYLPV